MGKQNDLNDFRNGMLQDISIASGRKSELDIKLDSFSNAGFDTDEVDHLRHIAKVLEDLKTKNKELAELDSFAKNWVEKLKTPADLYKEEVTRLQQAMTTGLLSTADYDKAKAKLDAENAPEIERSSSNRLFQSAEFGSQAARSAIIRNKMNGSVNKDEKEIKDATKKQASLMEDYVADFAEFRKDFYGNPDEVFAI